MEQLRQELSAYYRQYHAAQFPQIPEENRQLRQEIAMAMTAYAAAHPDCHPSLLKARLHEEMAARFSPVIFPHSPFFFEMGLRFAENWGNPASPEMTVGAWAFHHQQTKLGQRVEWDYIMAFQRHEPSHGLGVWSIWSGFDTDHHCLGYTRLLRKGVQGTLAEIAARQGQPCTADQAANLEAMSRSCRALLLVARRFAEQAEALLAVETDAQARRFLTMISTAARRVPAHPPRTFYEGLAMLWFLREVTATLECVGISVLGHIDRLLYPLYRDDLAAGRLTEEEARDLLARWMLPTDIKFHVEESAWPETSTCLELGGCDDQGEPLWNDVTRLLIETHAAHRLINPKLNCRYNTRAPREYLNLMSRTILAGHNHFALLNDDVLIPACIRAGKTEGEARRYVNGGCQETMVEGVEHSAGAYFYYCMPRVLNLCLQPTALPVMPSAAQALIPALITDAPDFDAFYAQMLAAQQQAMRLGTQWVRALGQEHWRMHPCPFFSTTLDGCIEHGEDYTRGGAKYNPSGLALIGLGTMVDSLYAIKTAVYEEGWVTLEEFRRCLAQNWAGYDALRGRIRRLPRFGHGDARVDALAARFVRDMGEYVRTLPAERGGTFQGSFFVYYAFQWFAAYVRATPDGRQTGDLLTQGIAPDRTTAPPSLTDVFHSLAAIDFRDYPGNAVLDVQLPLGGAIPEETLSAVLRTFAQLGGPTLQLNCVSVDELQRAQRHPEAHRDLVVRISGLSAHFVCLTKDVQDEIISRAMIAV